MPTCANCGRDSAEGFSFCPHCGSPLSASGTAETRKTVTVLFCDVTGSTRLGERLDPESLRKVMGRYFDEARACVERHGGTVEKFIGDAVMAVFGIPQVHEDDALRACRAAVEIRDAVRTLSKEVERDFGGVLQVRIGVNTGEVVAGDPSTGQALVTGDAVNVAARLEQVAPPGEVLIGRPTFELSRDAVAAEASEPLTLKGKTDPVSAFRLIEVHPTAPAFARRLDSPLVGREEELRALREAFDRAVAERACHLVTVLGPAGVGKSRLVEELLGNLPGARVLRGRCLAYGEGITFFPVVEVLKQAADIADFEDPAEAERKICSLVEDDEHGSLVCARVSQLLGLAEGEAVPEETLWAIRRFLEVIARSEPLVVVFDDVHWGEGTFLDLIEYVAEWTRDAPLVVVCPARPELLDVRPGWAGGKPNASTIVLEPLPNEESERLLTNLLGEVGVGEEVRTKILEAAEGTPLFVEQVVSMLIDEGALVQREGMWVAREDLGEIRIPPTIAALLAARLDGLSSEERSVIQRASVVGKVFYRGAVAALSPEEERSTAPGHLMSLVRKELLRPDRTTLPGEDAFRFRHQLIHDAAYDSTPKEVRAELHERFADWLERVAGERVEEQEEILGYHLEQAARYREQLGRTDERTLALRRRAGRHLGAAGHRARVRGDMGAAVNLLRRGVEIFPQGHPDRLALVPQLGWVMVETGPLNEATRLLRGAIEEAEAGGDPRSLAHARLAEVMVRVYSDPEGTSREAYEVANELIPVFEAEGDELGLARGYRLRSTAPWLQGRYAEMADDAQRAAEHALIAGDVTEQDLAHDMLGVALTFGPTPVAEALGRFDELLAASPGRRTEFEARNAILLGMSGRLDQARAQVERSRAMFLELGRPGWAASNLLALGVVELLAGDAAAAEVALRQGREEFLRLDERSVMSTVSAALAQALALQGRFEETREFIEEARALGSSDDMATEVYWRIAEAIVQMGRGDLDEAEGVVRVAVDLADGSDGLDDQGNTRAVLAQVVEAAGRVDEAVAILREALERYERKENTVAAALTRERLATLEGRDGG